MSDWQKGDLALCLKRGDWIHDTTGATLGSGPHYGEVLTVSAVGFVGQCLCLQFVEYHTAHSIRRPMNADRFRKIRPSAIKHIEALKDVPLPVRENEHA